MYKSHTHIISAIIINQLQTHQRKYSAEMHQQKYIFCCRRTSEKYSADQQYQLKFLFLHITNFNFAVYIHGKFA